ncbi:hypothetical protein [Enterovirga sp.]|uniref:hypothetical protein n=1 Tax=Enterovirga sp. TaxID=2026350 RepID=UPI002619833F|nr:hypothetical protein [Enterovirga sp.]MDB5592174.1 hypothetical protein [Enterovirga sp.]
MALNSDHMTDLSRSKINAQSDHLYMDALADRDAGRSNFAAFLLGGLVIAGGMLAFLYYDADNVGRGEITTGSIGRTEVQGAPPVPNIQVPAQPQRSAEPR